MIAYIDYQYGLSDYYPTLGSAAWTVGMMGTSVSGLAVTLSGQTLSAYNVQINYVANQITSTVTQNTGVNPIPNLSSTTPGAGTYVLKATIDSSFNVTYSWVLEST